MRHATLVLALAALASGDALASATTDARERAGTQDWLVVGAAGQVRHDGWWKLQNLTNGRPLVYGSRSFGINLVWGDSSSAPGIRFVPQPKDASQPFVLTNSPVAIQVAGGGYLKYGDRSFGINLVWSSTPVYEWELRASGLTPRPVELGAAFGVYNRAVERAVVYCQRSYGINLRWAHECGQFDEAARAKVGARIRAVSAWSRCEGTIRFRFVPLLVTGEGKRTPFTVESVYERRPEYAPPTTLQNPSDVYCVGMKHAERLAPGKWRVDIDVTSWSPNPRYPEPFAPWALSCRMTVVQGKPESLPNILGNNLRTTFGRDRCGRGDTWPW